MKRPPPQAESSNATGAHNLAAGEAAPRMSNLARRTVTAAVGLPLLALVVWAGSPWVTVVAAIAAAVGAAEFSAMLSRKGRRPVVIVAALFAAALVVAGHFVADGRAAYRVVLPVLGAGASAALAWSAMRRSSAVAGDAGLTAVAALYAGGLLLFVPLVRAEPDGREWLFLLFIGVFATDICAYAVGRTVGRHKMVPSISPGKTWEGAAGGLAGALAGVGIAAWGFGLGLAVWEALVLGALMAVVGQAGDLFESKLKRTAGVKDSGRLMPGHGGLLDRLDSILFNLPMLYLFVLWATR